MRRHLRYPPHQLIPTLGLAECRPARHEQNSNIMRRSSGRAVLGVTPTSAGPPRSAWDCLGLPGFACAPTRGMRQYRRPSSSSCRAVLTRSSGGIASSRATRSSFSSAPILGLPKARSNREFAATAITRRSASGRSETPPARAMYRGVRGVDTMPGCAGFGARDPAIRSCRDRRAALTAAVKKERHLEEPPRV